MYEALSTTSVWGLKLLVYAQDGEMNGDAQTAEEAALQVLTLLALLVQMYKY